MPSTFAITGVTATSSALGTTLKIGDTLDFTFATAQTVDAVTLSGGALPTLTLSNGAAATYTHYDTAGLHFAYTVLAGQDAANLSITSLDLHGASIDHTGTAGFQAGHDYATGNGSETPVTADLNGDGKADIVTANANSDSVSVLLGNGDGTFQAKHDYTTGSSPRAVTTADVNGDGKADIFTANANSNSVSVLLGNGDGTFQANHDYATGAAPFAVTMVDVNGDGKADLVTANYLDNTVSVLLGNGDGTFQAKHDYATGVYPFGVATADVNGDGKADLITPNVGTSTVSVLLGNGDGTFQAKHDYTTGSSPYSLATADLNGDGKADLITPNAYDNTVSVLLGNGDGTFQARHDYATGANPYAVATADMNGDGKADIVTANNNDGTVSVLLGNGDGTFQAKQDYATSTYPLWLTAADLNGDGKADLVTTNSYGGSVSVHLNSGSPTSQIDATSLGSAIGIATGLTLDATAPNITSFTTSLTSPSNATSLTFTLSFSEAVLGLTASDLLLSRGGGGLAAGTVGTPVTTDGGLTYTVAVAGLTDEGVVRLDLDPASHLHDAAGNALSGGPSGQAVLLDHIAPSAPTLALLHDTGASNADGVTGDARVLVVTSEPGSTLHSVVDGVAVATYDPSSLSQGAHTVAVTQTDTAGNVSQIGSVSFTLDSIAPTVHADVSTGRGVATAVTGNALANDQDASALHLSAIQFGNTKVDVPDTGSMQVAGAHGTLTVAVDGSYSYQAMSHGSDNFTKVVTDAAGNTSQSSLDITVNALTSDSFRFYNEKTGSHLFTTDAAEAAHVATMSDYRAEGTPWSTADKAGDTTDVFRFYDAKTDDHFYTTSTVERDSVLKDLPNYHYEGVGFQAYAAEGAAGTEVLERFYNAGTGTHHYAQADEAVGIRAGAAGAGWVDEGKAFVVQTDMHWIAA